MNQERPLSGLGLAVDGLVAAVADLRSIVDGIERLSVASALNGRRILEVENLEALKLGARDGEVRSRDRQQQREK